MTSNRFFAGQPHQNTFPYIGIWWHGGNIFSRKTRPASEAEEIIYGTSWKSAVHHFSSLSEVSVWHIFFKKKLFSRPAPCHNVTEGWHIFFKIKLFSRGSIYVWKRNKSISPCLCHSVFSTWQHPLRFCWQPEPRGNDGPLPGQGARSVLPDFTPKMLFATCSLSRSDVKRLHYHLVNTLPLVRIL